MNGGGSKHFCASPLSWEAYGVSPSTTLKEACHNSVVYFF